MQILSSANGWLRPAATAAGRRCSIRPRA